MASEVIERSLYNGKYRMVHNPNAKGRAPRYVVNETEKPKGVTTILGKTLYKDLIGWAVGMTQDYLRDKLPVITEQDLVEAGKAYMYRRDAGAATGSEAHALVEAYLKGNPLKDGSIEALNAYNAFVKWFEEVTPTVINVEEVIYSEQLKFAGTYDCMLRINDKVTLCDLKTTNPSKQAPNGIYSENFIQLGAYALAHEEQRAYEEANGGTNLEPIGDLAVISAKKDGKLDVVYASELGMSVSDCVDIFVSVMRIYGFMGEVTNKLGG